MNNIGFAHKREVVETMVSKLKMHVKEYRNLSITDTDDLYRINRTDELVWQMASIAHQLIESGSALDEYYPELKPFLDYLVTHYPALKGYRNGK